MVPTRDRGKSNTVYSTFYSVGQVMFFALSSVVNNDNMSLDTMYGIFIGLCILDAAIYYLFIKETISPLYMYSHLREDEMRKVFNSYLTPYATE